MLAFYKTLRNLTRLYNYRLVFRLCSQSSDGQLKRQIVGLTTRKTLAARVLQEKTKQNSVVSTFIIHRPRAVTRCCSAPTPRSLAITLARFSEQWASN